MHISGLANTVGAVLGLSIHRRVPVAIIKNNCIRTCQVDTQTTTTSAQNETEYFGVTIEAIHKALASIDTGTSVKAHICVPIQVQKRFQYVQHFAHLS